MRMAVLRNFLCFELEKGVLCVGIIGILGSLMQFVFFDGNLIANTLDLAHLLVNASLTFGTIKGIPDYLLPWLILHLIAMFIIPFLLIIFMIYICFHVEETSETEEDKSSSFGLVLFAIIFYIIYSYICMAVLSLYVLFKKERQRDVDVVIPQNLCENVSFERGQSEWETKPNDKKNNGSNYWCLLLTTNKVIDVYVGTITNNMNIKISILREIQ